MYEYEFTAMVADEMESGTSKIRVRCTGYEINYGYGYLQWD